MISERGPILFVNDYQGLTRVHFMHRDNPFTIDDPFFTVPAT